MCQEFGLGREASVFPLSERFVEMGGIPVAAFQQMTIAARRFSPAER